MCVIPTVTALSVARKFLVSLYGSALQTKIRWMSTSIVGLPIADEANPGQACSGTMMAREDVSLVVYSFLKWPVTIFIVFGGCKTKCKKKILFRKKT